MSTRTSRPPACSVAPAMSDVRLSRDGSRRTLDDTRTWFHQLGGGHYWSGDVLCPRGTVVLAASLRQPLAGLHRLGRVPAPTPDESCRPCHPSASLPRGRDGDGDSGEVDRGRQP